MMTFVTNVTRRHIVRAILCFVTALEADVTMTPCGHQTVTRRDVSVLEHATTGHKMPTPVIAVLALPRRLIRRRRRMRRWRSRLRNRQHRRSPTLGAPGGGLPIAWLRRSGCKPIPSRVLSRLLCLVRRRRRSGGNARFPGLPPTRGSRIPWFSGAESRGGGGSDARLPRWLSRWLIHDRLLVTHHRLQSLGIFKMCFKKLDKIFEF